MNVTCVALGWLLVLQADGKEAPPARNLVPVQSSPDYVDPPESVESSRRVRPTRRDLGVRPANLEQSTGEPASETRAVYVEAAPQTSEPTPPRYGAPPAEERQAPASPPQDSLSAPVDNAPGQSPRVTAHDLMAGLLLVPPSNGGLEGTPLRLAEAFNRANFSQHRQMVDTYWRLAAAVCEFHLRHAEFEQYEELARALATRATGRDATALASGLETARAKRAAARVQAMTLQVELARLLDDPHGKQLPIPVDVPHTASYNTFYERIYTNRTAPADAYRIHKVLPAVQETITAEAKSVLAALDYLEATVAEFQADRVSLAEVISAQNAWAERQLAFVRSVESYNRDIARYALPLAPAGADPNRLAGMLIKSPTPGPGAETQTAQTPRRDPNVIRSEYVPKR